MDIKEKIIQFINVKGPVIPVQVSKKIDSDILMASVHLSELASENKVKVSSVKIGGGSPLYYLAGQEPRLQNFANNLHEKQKKAYDLLQQKKILRDKEIEPVVRVALREIKDFAVPLRVNHNTEKEIFWKWYLLPGPEAESIIKSILKPSLELKTIKKKPIAGKEPIDKKPMEKKIIDKEIEKKVDTKKPKNYFDGLINDYFTKNKIDIINKKILRKDSEIEFTVRLPSAVGSLIYYCRAKNKKRITDGDLSTIYIQSQLKKLPVLAVITGELTKKAKEMLNNEFKGMSLKKI